MYETIVARNIILQILQILVHIYKLQSVSFNDSLVCLYYCESRIFSFQAYSMELFSIYLTY